jgi:hypothetical protein
VRNGHTTGSPASIADRVNSILASRKLSLYQASIKSAKIFGRHSPYQLPHNFYSNLKRHGFSPSLYQVFALSRISRYDLMDWLRVFGFEIEAIPRLQIKFLSSRTILLDSSLDDPNSLIPWFRNLRNAGSPAGITPLSPLLEWTKPVRVGSLAEVDDSGVIYAKIGQQDALAFPELLGGSIVRVRPCKRNEKLAEEIRTGKRLVLLEHDKGLCCCRIRFVGKDRFTVVSSQLPDGEVALKTPIEARIIGIIDLEIRSVIRSREPEVSSEFTSRWKPGALPLNRPGLARSFATPGGGWDSHFALHRQSAAKLQMSFEMLGTSQPPVHFPITKL